MEAAVVLEITPETLRERAQACRADAERLRKLAVSRGAEAIGLEREAQALEDAERLRASQASTPSARAALAGEIAAFLARCRKPRSSSEIAEHFAVSVGRARQSLELLVEIGMVYRSGLKRGTRYRILRDGEEAPDEPQPFGERWHERVRDVAVRLEAFTTAEIVAELPELSPSTVQRWLGVLVDDGVLTRERVGKAYAYAYNPPQAPGRVAVAEDKTPRRSRDRAVAGTGKSRYSRAEVGEIVRVAKAAGAEIKPQKHGYAVVVEGEAITSIPRTASDHRSLKNARGALKRNGVRA